MKVDIYYNETDVKLTLSNFAKFVDVISFHLITVSHTKLEPTVRIV